MIPCPTPRPWAHLALRRHAIQDLGVFHELFRHAFPALAGRSEVLPGVAGSRLRPGQGVRVYALGEPGHGPFRSGRPLSPFTRAGWPIRRPHPPAPAPARARRVAAGWSARRSAHRCGGRGGMRRAIPREVFTAPKGPSLSAGRTGHGHAAKRRPRFP